MREKNVAAIIARKRNRIRYRLEDMGVPDVIAFMAAKNARLVNAPGIWSYGYAPIAELFLWDRSPEGPDFWSHVAAESGDRCMQMLLFGKSS